MNKAILVGRLTKDVELRVTSNNVDTCAFTLAINRKFKDQEGNYQADFINCVAWRQSARFLSEYAHKGDMVAIEGSIQTRNYNNKDGAKVFVTEVICDQVELLSKSNSVENKAKQFALDNGVDFIAGEFKPNDIDSDDLPF